MPSIPQFYLIDTPGFDDTHKTDTQVLREITNWLSTAYTADLKLTGIIYLHRILDVKIGGTAMKNLRMFKKLCGDDSLGSVVLATTFWGMTKPEIEQSREAQLTTRSDFWGHFIQKGSKVFRQDQGRESAAKIIDYLVSRRKPVVLEIQREMNEQNKTLDQTGAGVEVQGDLAKAKAAHEEEMASVRADMQRALAKKDIEWQEELAATKKEIEEKIRKDEESRAQLHIDRENLRQEEERERAEERRQHFEAMLEYQKNVMQLQHELELMRKDNQHQLAEQELRWKLQREQDRVAAERARAEASSCTVM